MSIIWEVLIHITSFDPEMCSLELRNIVLFNQTGEEVLTGDLIFRYAEHSDTGQMFPWNFGNHSAG